MDINKYIGEKIRSFRQSKNITQEEVAEFLGVTTQAISRYELGDRKTDNDVLFRLADYFNVSVNDFFPPIELKNDTASAVTKTDVTNENQKNINFNDLNVLFNNNQDILTKDDEDMIRFVIEKRKKEIEEKDKK